MIRLGLTLLRGYLWLFAFFAPNREYARCEHALLEGSLREAYAEYRERGLARAPAGFAALWDHLAELWPPALTRKTLADAACAPGRDNSYLLRLASSASLILLAGSGIFALLAPHAGNMELPAHTVARAFAEGDARAGEFEVVAEPGSLQEAIYVGSGGAVCIDPELKGAELTDEIVNTPSSAEQLEQCADYALPDSPRGHAPRGLIGTDVRPKASE